jgi:FkbM family methyltransferase
MIRSRINYWLGRAAYRLGYGVLRADRIPQGNLNLLETAFAMLRLLRKDQIRIVQVGAYDGLEQDPLVHVLSDGRVEAILVEPQAEPYRILVRTFAENPRIRIENVAVSDRSGKGLLHVPTAAGVSPFASLRPTYRFRLSSHQQVPVQLMTVSDLLAKHGWTNIDMLQIDAEGYDLAILKMVFDTGLLPAIVNLESYHLQREERAELRRLFAYHGYNFLDWGFDTLAIRRPLIEMMFASYDV